MAAPHRALSAALLLTFCALAMGLGPDWYSCDPATCTSPSCVCPSTEPPLTADGTPLPDDEIPQFIIITHDDAITVAAAQGMRSILDAHTNNNGCDHLPATFFVLKQDTDCELARKLWEEGNELAIHSTTHVPLTEPFKGDLSAEMFGARVFLNETCGIPLEDVVGFRTPLLAHNPPVRAAIAAEAGMLYDSSILEFFPSATSPAAGERLYPYTMDDGIPQNCNFFSGARCTEEERYKGLWEVPLLETQAPNGTLLFSMDPGTTDVGGYDAAKDASVLDGDALEGLLKTNFDFSYNGNRAPFGLYVHAPWINKDTVKAANNFLEYALGLDNVYVATARQVIEWMKNPVPASELKNTLACGKSTFPTSSSDTPADDTQSAAAGDSERCRRHTVAANETGFGIATSYGQTLADLVALNPEVNIDLLQVGDVLLIPPFDSECDDGPPTMEEEVPPAEDEEAAGTADEESTSTEEEQNTEEQAAAEEEVAAAEEEQAAADEEQNADEGDNNNNKKDNKKGRKKGDRNRN